MSFGYYYNLNNSTYLPQNIGFRANATGMASTPAPLAKPIETVSKTIESSVDAFVPEGEKKKKSYKKAITVGSSVLVVSGLVALLNPKFSSKFITKLKNASESAGKRIESSKNDYLKSKFHQASKKTLDWGVRTLEFSNNINSAKDVGFKWLCCDKKQFNNVKNTSLRNFLRKVDSGFVKVMSKVHNAITKWFDSISKHTVFSKYNGASKKMDNLESLLKQYRNKLSTAEQAQFDAKLAEISKTREFFSKTNTAQRFDEQEKLMSNLERDFLKQYRAYRNGFTNKWVNKGEHIDKNMTFWAEKIMQPTRDKVERQGLDVVEKLVGNEKGQKGLYDDIYSMLSSKLSSAEKQSLDDALKVTGKKLRKANHSETVEYFDKKRDLVLGGAPTDIVTALGGLGLSGIAIATADTKEDKISRALTGGFPIIAGIGASMAFTAMLFSGVQGLLYGFLTSIGLSKLGSIADHYILGNKKDDIENNPTPTKNPFQQSLQTSEVKNA